MSRSDYGTMPTGGIKQFNEQYYGDLIRNGSGPDNYQQYKKQEWICDTSNKFANIPALGSYSDGYTLTNYGSTDMPGGLTHIILTYTYTSLTPPDDTTVEQSSYLEEPIQRHPSFADNAGTAASPLNGALFDPDTGAFTGWEASSPYAGMDTYIVGSTNVTVTQYSTSEFSSQADDIGTKQAPSGYGGSDWLLIASNRAKQGYYFTISNTYLKSAIGWDSDWYD